MFACKFLCLLHRTYRLEVPEQALTIDGIPLSLGLVVKGYDLLNFHEHHSYM